jgi:hypothetical protein
LSPQQQRAIKRHLQSQKGAVALMMGMIACTALFAFFIIWKADSEDGVLTFPDLIVSGGIVTLLLGVLGYYLTGDWFVFFAGDDLEEATVESAVGNVVWRGTRYQMRTDSRRLRALRRVHLPPLGDYRFYYLPRTGLVVMAEKISDMSVEVAVPSLLQVLASTNNFSLVDLAQNHKGELSLRQENHLFGEAAFSGLVLLIGVALFVSMISRILRGTPSATYLLLLIIGAIVMLRFGWSTANLIADIWSGKVISVEGSVGREIHRARFSESYYYVLGMDQFQVSYAAYNALFEGKPYRIFYVPHSKRLVSIEPV